MGKNNLHAVTLTSVLSMVSFSFPIHASFAQTAIAPDQTLPNNTVINFNSANQTYTIRGGTQVGANQFHSFQDFSVPTANTAHFDNALTTTNVIGRVTGSNISSIDGTLKTNGTTDLYLINPNGIIFGANAKLDIAGSFSASTANSIKFSDGSEFSATNPQAPPVLQVNMPLGLQYGNSNPASVTNAGNLSVGKALMLSGGSVTSTGNLYVPNGDLRLEAVMGNVNATQFEAGTATLSATQRILIENGRFQTAGDLSLLAKDGVVLRDSVTNPLNLQVGGNLLIQGDRNVDVSILSNPNSSLFAEGNVVLRSDSPIAIDAHWNGGGDLRVEKLNGLLGDIYSSNDPVFQFSGNFSFSSYAGASLQILVGGAVQVLGNIRITGSGSPFNNSTVTLSDGSSLLVNGTTRPVLDIRAGVLPSAFFPSPTVTSTGTPRNANIIIYGDIVFNDSLAGSNGLVHLTNQFAPNTSLVGDVFVGSIITANSSWDAGSIVIDSKGMIRLSNPAFASVLNTASTLNGGDIKLLANGNIVVSSIDTSSTLLNAGNVQLISRNGGIDTTLGDINAYAGFSGVNGGEVTLTAGQDIRSGSIDTSGGLFGSGKDIEINARSVFILDGSQLISSTYGKGNAGNITITASDTVLFSGTNNGFSSAVFSDVDTGAVGNAGNISISARSMYFFDGAQLTSSTSGKGNAGDITITASDTVVFDNSYVNSDVVDLGAVGNAGNININARSVSFTGNAGLSSSTSGQGNAGNITITASDTVLFSGTNNGFPSGAFSNVDVFGNGDGGNISITAHDIFLTDGARLSTNLGGQGNGGNIVITATDSVILSSSGVFSSVVQNGTWLGNGVGNAGDISINAPSVFLTDSARLSTLTSGKGNAGNITISASDAVSFDIGSLALSTVDAGAIGNGGNISVNTRSISLTGISQLLSYTRGKGNAGNITITATDSVLFSEFSSGIFSNVEFGAVGDAGNLSINTRFAHITDGAQLSSSTSGRGNAGNIIISAIDEVLFSDSGAFSKVNIGAVGNAGNISINARSASITENSRLSSSTSGRGSAGNIAINTIDKVLFSDSGAFSNVDTGAVGNAGNVSINASSIFLTERAELTSSTSGKGNAGNVTLTATDSVSFAKSFVFSQVNAGAVGNSGTVSIDARFVSLTNGAQVLTFTSGTGNAGNITIIATDSVLFSGINSGYPSGAFSSVESSAVGNGGTVSISTPFVSFTDGALLSVSTRGQGNSGNVVITADSIFLSNSKILSDTFSNFGQGGTININAQTLNIQNGGKISTSTSSSSNAGNIKLVLGQSLLLNGLGTLITAGTTSISTGNGGGIFIDPPLVSITNGAGISVNSLGKGNGGNMDIFAGKFVFANNAFLSANTASGEGGNINLQIVDIFFPRNNSSINATAAGTGNGGNITLSALFLVSVPFENNDIFANAFFGKGGNINITTQGIFGLEFRPQLTPLSDITASSQFGVQGNVNVNTPGVDPSKGLNNLPVDIGDPSRLVRQRCIADQRGSEFIITGKGGVPAKPSDRPSNIGALDNFGTLPDRSQTSNLTPNSAEPTTTPEVIVEATGWTVNAQNQVVLVAGANPTQTKISCP